MTARTPADDAGEDLVDQLKASLLAPETRRAERLKTQRDDARAESDRHWATLAAVKSLADEWDARSVQRRNFGQPDSASHAASELRAVLAADQVSLADVREPTDCASCGEDMPRGECPKSERPCGHHCNHSWEQDLCHWCGAEFGENNSETVSGRG